MSSLASSSGRPGDSSRTSSNKSLMFPGFEAVYVSPHIRQIRVACRLKVYQTIFVVGMIPTSLLMLDRGLLLPSHVGYVAGFSVFSLIVLGVMGEFFRKFVGILYLSEDKSKVIISHNTFLGKRADILMDTNNLVPLAETPENLDKELVWKIYLYSGEPKTYYICTKYGGILSRRKFADIFGEEITNK